jgi:phosphatidylserine/phosphatidylglycerophosphate/cardiolipin synthase-like enzyme
MLVASSGRGRRSSAVEHERRAPQSPTDATRRQRCVSTSAQGTVVDAQGGDVAGLTLVLHDVSGLLERELGRVEKTASGSFTISYQADNSELGRRLRLRIRIGHHLLKEIEKDDVTAAELGFGSIPLASGMEATSVLATLGTGSPSRLTQGNAIEWLADNVDAWGRTAALIKRAGTTGGGNELHIMQLQLDVGPFSAVPSSEKPELVLKFDPESMTLPGGTVRDLTNLDDRIEHLILDASKRGVIVRFQFTAPTVDKTALAAFGLTVGLGLGLVLGIGLILLAVGVVASLVAFVVGGFVTGAVLGALALGALGHISRHYEELANEVSAWFVDAQAQGVSVRILKSEPYSLTHTKIVSDGKAAVLHGSPFEQVYFDGPGHAIDDFRRGGNAGKGPIHEMSVGVRGPAVGHLAEVFNSHWNRAGPTDQLPDPPALPAAVTTANPGEFIAPVQVIRTINGGLLPALPKGEKGVLEAYLRAIHFAKRFIYLENQYFTNEAVTQALIAALKANEDLQVILVVPVEPDIPRYPHWQRGLIQRIAKSLGSDAENRFGAFTLWSHAAPDATHAKPRLRANYAHTKSAIIDNNWATVGSANLDGASLDFFQLLFYWRLPNVIFQAGENRNTETNCVVFEPQVPAGGSAVDALRRRLWAEHLGFVNPDGSPKTNAAELADSPPRDDWVKRWKERAEAKRAGLATNPNTVSAIRVLPWPLEPWRVNPERHLKALKVPVSSYDLVRKGPPSRAFKLGP